MVLKWDTNGIKGFYFLALLKLLEDIYFSFFGFFFFRVIYLGIDSLFFNVHIQRFNIDINCSHSSLHSFFHWRFYLFVGYN
jgi:hypothetical protein